MMRMQTDDGPVRRGFIREGDCIDTVGAVSVAIGGRVLPANHKRYVRWYADWIEYDSVNEGGCARLG